MEKHPFAIIRNLRGRDPSIGRQAGPSTRSFEAEEPKEVRVELDELSSAEEHALREDSSVEAVARVMPTTLVMPVESQAPAAPGWGIVAVAANASSKSGDGVIVAVLDTGIDAHHPAFDGVNLVQQNFVGGTSEDIKGHGTHCAGTIFGRDVENQRIGVARGVKEARIGKVLKDDGRGTSVALFEGMQWAVSQGAKVISMSLGFDFSRMVELLQDKGIPPKAAMSMALEAYRANLRAFDAIMEYNSSQVAFGRGAVVLAATGNESNRPTYEVAASVPAAAQNVMAVGALERLGEKFGVAAFSNRLPVVSAPGVQILSAWPGGGTRLLSGTSMATPHAAGVAALWWEELHGTPAATPAGVVARLRATARANVFSAGTDPANRGEGLVTSPS